MIIYWCGIVYYTIFRQHIPSGNQTWLAGKSLWMEVLIGKSPINGPFSIAMFDYQRVMIEFDLYNDFILVSSPVDFRCTLRCQWNIEHDKFSNLSGWLIRDLTNPFPVLDTPKKQWLIVKDVQKIGPLKGVLNIGRMEFMIGINIMINQTLPDASSARCSGVGQHHQGYNDREMG